MTGSYQQKRDLQQFGEQVRRLLITRIITARNIDKIDDEQMKFLETLLPTAADLQLLLDNFKPSVDVAGALAELEPLSGQVQSLALEASREDFRGLSVVFRSMRTRVDRAIALLKADPR